MSDVNGLIINESKKHSKHLVEYFLLKLSHIYILAILLTAPIFFFLYRGNEKIPQDYLVELLVLGIIGVVINGFTGIHNWIKNRVREKDLQSTATVTNQTKDTLESSFKLSQSAITVIFLLTLVIICAVKLNKGDFTKSMTYGLGITSLLIFGYTAFVFVYSFYNVAARSYQSVINKTVTATEPGQLKT